MDVSVIIINYNTFDLTSDCIRSIIKNTEGLNYEIIIVDNASTEIDPIEFKECFPSVILVVCKINHGFAKGNNLGIQKASGEYILLLNSDTEILNNAVLLSWQRIKNDNSIGALTCMILSKGMTLQYPGEKFPNLSTELRELFRLNKNLSDDEKANMYLGDRFDHLTEREVDWVWGTFFMTRKSVIGALGGKLPDYFFMYGEDIDWCWKIKKLGFSIVYSPSGKIMHYGGASDYFDSDLEKFFKRMLPNKYEAVARNTTRLHAWLIYFVKAVHHLTLRTQKDWLQATWYFKFLTSRVKG